MLRATVALVYRPSEEHPWRTFCAGQVLESGQIVTARHCAVIEQTLQPGGYLAVGRYRDWAHHHGTFTAVELYRVGALDADHDLAILEPPADARDPVDYVDLARTEPATGDPVWLVGHPDGIEWSVTAGIVSRARRLECDAAELAQTCTAWIQTDAKGYFGNSGGGLYNAAGELVGVTSHGAGSITGDLVPHLLFAAPARYVADLLD